MTITHYLAIIGYFILVAGAIANIFAPEYMLRGYSQSMLEWWMKNFRLSRASVIVIIRITGIGMLAILIWLFVSIVLA